MLSLNRTMDELKWGSCPYGSTNATTFNRTMSD